MASMHRSCLEGINLAEFSVTWSLISVELSKAISGIKGGWIAVLSGWG